MGKLIVEIALEYLRNEGVKHVFGIPGGLLHPFFAAVERDSEIQLIVAKHEEGAGFMADGAARVTNSLAVCAATSGPGATNLFTSVAVAFSDNVPMLVITGQAPSMSIGKGAAQETGPQDIDIVGMFRPITKYSAMVNNPQRFTHHLRRALRLALTGRRGPVHLNVPVDFWKHPIEEETILPNKFRPSMNVFDREQVKGAAAIIAQSKSPVILAGSGMNSVHGREMLVEFVERFGIRVASTPAAKSVFPEDHPLSVGVFGLAGHRSATELILGETVDTLIAIGTSLNETTTLGWDNRLRPSNCLIQIDIEVDAFARHYGIDFAMVGDGPTILNEISFHLDRLTERNSVWPTVSSPLLNDDNFDNSELRRSQESPMAPPAWRRLLCELLPENAIIFSDIGGHMLFNIHHLVIQKSQRFIINLHFGSMGHGVVAPIGASLVSDQPVFAIVGDAGFAMNGMEILVANEYDVDVTWIVENNQMHGITYHGSKMVDGGQPLNAIVNRKQTDITAMARAMGAFSRKATTLSEFETVFAQSQRTKQPSVLELVVNPDYSPPLEARAKTVSTEFAGFKS